MILTGAEMGFKCYRLSIAWTRILPNCDDDIPNEVGLKFYEDLFIECRKYGGWRDKRMIDAYLKYCRIIFARYKNLVKYWITFNEIHMRLFTVQ